jgi:hypothetical protein
MSWHAFWHQSVWTIIIEIPGGVLCCLLIWSLLEAPGKWFRK